MPAPSQPYMIYDVAGKTNNILNPAGTFNMKSYYVAWSIRVPGKTFANLIADWLALPVGQKDQAYSWIKPIGKLFYIGSVPPVWPALYGYAVQVVDLGSSADDFFAFLYAYYANVIATLYGQSFESSSDGAIWWELP